jgi:hypothetical protein
MPERGPYLKVAALCENVIQDNQGVLSLIRIIDRTTRTIQGPTVPEQMEPFSQRLYLVLMFVSGEEHGTRELNLVMVKPNGMRLPMTTTNVLFEGQDRGANVVIQADLQADMEGLYWIEVLIQDEFVTRVPWRVVYQRLTQRLPGL